MWELFGLMGFVFVVWALTITSHATSEIIDMLTNKQSARLIADAYNAGKDDGDEEGYKRGYEDGHINGVVETEHRLAVGDVYRVDGESVPVREGEMSPKEIYDAGWNDGYHGWEPDLTMKGDKVYLCGYKDGKLAVDGKEEGK